MKSLFDLLFIKNYNFYIFMFFLGLLGLSVYIVRLDIDNRIKKLAVLSVSVLFGIAMLFRTAAKGGEDGYSTSFRPHESGCLIDAYNEYAPNYDYYGNIIRFLHYFEGKNLEMDCTVEDREHIAGHILEHAPVVYISYIDNNYVIDSKVMDDIAAHTNHIKKDKRLYLIDKTWKSADTIVCIKANNQVYFLSKNLLDDIANGDYVKDYLDEKDLEKNDISFMNKLRGERGINQVILLMIIFLLGLGVCLISFKGRNNWLIFFMAFPIGVAMVCSVFIVSIIAGLPFRKITISIIFILMLSIIAVIIRMRHIEIKKELLLKQLGVFSLLSVFFVYMKFFYMTADSFAKTINGVRLAEFNMSKKAIIGGFMEYGMLEPIINGIGWKFHVDFMYALYILMPVCSLGIIGYGMMRSRKSNPLLGVITFVCCIFLVTNYDFVVVGTWILSNGTMATMFLTLVLVIFLKINEDERANFIIAMISLCVGVTRLEGGCYLCLIGALICGVNKVIDKHTNMNLFMGIPLLIWQISLWFLNREDEIFWNRNQSIIVMAGSLLIMVWPYILRINIKLMRLLNRYYYEVFLIALGVSCCLMYYFGPELSKNTAAIILRHFATSYESNSGGLWGFYFLMVPICFIDKTKEKAFSLSLVVDYILLSYLIFSVREGFPIHFGPGDSCRRVIQQIIPLAMFLTVYDKNVWTLREGVSVYSDNKGIECK